MQKEDLMELLLMAQRYFHHDSRRFTDNNTYVDLIIIIEFLYEDFLL